MKVFARPRLAANTVIEYNTTEKFIVDSETLIIPHFIHKDLHHVTGTFDLSARGVVPALDHGCHSDNEIVLHFDDVFRFGCDFILKLRRMLFHKTIVDNKPADRDGKQNEYG